MRSRSFRRHQTERHMQRRLKEDRNQHYDNLGCLCWTDPKAMARFKEQPKQDCWCCKNERHKNGRYEMTMQELRWFCLPIEEMVESAT